MCVPMAIRTPNQRINLTAYRLAFCNEVAILNKETAAELKALRQMKKDYERLKVEHDLLKKAIEFTSKRKAMSSRSSTTTSKKGSR